MWSNRCWNKFATVVMVIQLGTGPVAAQEPASPPAVQKLLDRLDVLEKQNQMLLEEIRSLRNAIKSQLPTGAQATSELNDRVSVAENRIAEQAQTKVGASQRLPVSLKGMILFDSNLIHGTDGDYFQQSYSNYSEGAPGGGATLRQSIIGLTVDGPRIAEGRIHGSISMDFDANAKNEDVFRIRNGDISLDWSDRSITVGQDKTIIAPLQPTSFAHVGTPALSGAGNLWLWRPQIKYEERRAFSSSTAAAFQAALLVTAETYAANLPAQTYIANTRPAFQARVGLTHNWSDQTKLSVGIGVHESESHIDGKSIPSRVVSSDFLYKPLRWLEVSGTLFRGENFANLGGLPTGTTVEGTNVIPIKGTAGWMQVALPLTKRLTLDAYAGRQVNATHDLAEYQIAHTLVYAGNLLFRVGPNVILGFEGGHEDVVYVNHTLIFANRYDATLAYLF